ncbi:MAG TPA: aminotransferase class I/II-fold pyridoxal phosphate-dependent enzyme, partial [Burkholderiales bacterium]|nr:aminotransferase class I/II-fold pyridoxal phosphate-dependent enzyme [Burkholderiales bacterium]
MKEVNFCIPNWENEIAEKHSKLLIVRPKRAKSQYYPTMFHFNQKFYCNFVSNDYLSLACHSNLIEGLNIGASKFGVGSTGAITLSGYTELHHQLSTSIAKWLGFEKCLIFSNGYQLNVGVFSALTNSNSIIWFDKRCHASHIDGILLSKSKFISFIPEDLPKISTKIASQKDKLHIILTEGTFSMDGTCTYLEQVLQLKKCYPDNILLIIDDAHGIATLNSEGKGTLEPLEINLVDILIGTFGKSFGTQGGFLVSNSNIADYLSQTVRS